MADKVALDMLQQEGSWLLGALRGHLDPGETPEQALQRHRRSAHVFWADLAVSLEQSPPWRPGGRRGVAVRDY
jgi:hypothetical protein